MMQEQGDFRFAVGPKDLQASYAVSDQIALLANGFLRQYSWNHDSVVVSQPPPELFNEQRRNSKMRYGELAAGYFKPAGGSQFVFEMYAGVGLGKLNYEGDFSQEQKKMEVNLNRVFVQPAFGIKRDQYEIGLSTRFSSLSLNQMSTAYFSSTELIAEEIDGLDSGAHLFAEPAITLRAGFRQMKLQAQAGFEAKLNDRTISTAPLRLSIGLHLNLNTSKKYDE